ncbi:MAG: lactate utilization protein C [Deltaproteobacteria bacterium]|nr:MAG: lactate utilization protein C [Deltaproteobacteria bacterium]
MKGNQRDRFLGTVRSALGHAGDLSRQAPNGLFPTHPSEKSLARLERIRHRQEDERDALIQRLKTAAEPISLEVHCVSSASGAATVMVDKIVSVPTEWNGPRQVCTWNDPLIDSLGLKSLLAKHGIPVVSMTDFVPLADADRISADQQAALRKGVVDSFVGITTADFCVADTGTLVLRTRPGQPRSVSLVPSIHMAVITADRIVANFKELYAILRWNSPDDGVDLSTCMTFISGPSKTADIEATLVHGAHGPRAMVLIVIYKKNSLRQ